MKKYYLIIAVSMTLFQGCYVPPPYQASTRVSVVGGYPGANIGIHFSTYPDLVPIPGYPVYYAPGANWNYFFYDGLYWVFQGDNWYVSSWYNGPWDMVSYYDVPVFVLRIPVRYYRLPPPYFRGWHADAPPRWGEHWGRDWEQHRSGWDRWDRSAVPPPAPLPAYQRSYSGDRYPRTVEQQHTIRSESYRYQPRDPVAQQYYQPRKQQDQQREQYQRRQPEQQRQDDQQREQYRQRQPEQQRQEDQHREQYRQRQLEQQRQEDQQREQYRQRQLEQQRQDDQQREQYRQRQPEPQRPQGQQREQYQRQPEPQRQQDQQREQYQQRQPEQQRQQQDREPQRSQPESGDKGRDDPDAKQKYGREKKGDADRDQNR
jgi:hypothetical protein